MSICIDHGLAHPCAECVNAKKAEEKRYFLKTKGPCGPVYSIGYGYPEYHHTMFKHREGEVIRKEEIPKEFWDLPINTYINFFELGIKPRIKVKA